jgi:hypothetical protein
LTGPGLAESGVIRAAKHHQLPSLGGKIGLGRRGQYEAPCGPELNYLPKLFEIISLFQTINEHILTYFIPCSTFLQWFKTMILLFKPAL